MALAVGTLLTVLDSIAKGVSLFEGGVGVLGTEANTVSKGAANNVDTLKAIADIDVQADLAPAFQSRAAGTKAAALYRGLGGTVIQRALDRHYGDAGSGSLNAFMAAQDKRVHPDLRKIGMQIDALNAFAPTAVDPVCSFAVTGSGAGTFTAGSDVDITLYGKANMSVRTTSVIGASTITASLTMKKVDGSQQLVVVTIPNGTGSGVEIAIGVVDTDMFIGVVTISISGGTSGDAFKIISKVERTVAL